MSVWPALGLDRDMMAIHLKLPLETQSLPIAISKQMVVGARITPTIRNSKKERLGICLHVLRPFVLP